jgi:hypothetical protein
MISMLTERQHDYRIGKVEADCVAHVTEEIHSPTHHIYTTPVILCSDTLAASTMPSYIYIASPWNEHP